MKKIEFFKVEGDSINRIRKHCPKCGPAVFLADHKDRLSCGKCGYTEYKGGERKQPQPKVLMQMSNIKFQNDLNSMLEAVTDMTGTRLVGKGIHGVETLE